MFSPLLKRLNPEIKKDWTVSHRRYKIRSPVKAGSLLSTTKAQPNPVVKMLDKSGLHCIPCGCATLESGVQGCGVLRIV